MKNKIYYFGMFLVIWALLFGMFFIGFLVAKNIYEGDELDTYELFNKEINDFCNNLDLKDFIYDCSEWVDYNKEYNTGIPNGIQVTCIWKSRSFGTYPNSNSLVGCGGDYLRIKYPEFKGVNEVNVCNGESKEEALNRCLGILPKKLRDGVTIIEPV